MCNKKKVFRFIFASIVFQFVAISFSNAQDELPPFKIEDQPAAPDYSNPQYWAALPFRNDIADIVPQSETWISDSLKKVDVFYIYPTLYSKGETWNADVNNTKLNKRIDKYPIKFQSSAFNNVARVYAPRYRQAIIDSYSDTLGNGIKALDFAYEDIKRAFEYYIEHYNNGRPIIIASHSQGTTHSRRLLRDYFDSTDLKNRLVCAYTIGYEMKSASYQMLKPCGEPAETGCYITWASFREGYTPESGNKLFGDVCVNPVSWKRDTIVANSYGGVMLNLNRKKPFESKVRIHQNYLWVKTKIPIVKNWNVMHLVDYNLFWFDIRNNATLRVNEYLKKNRRSRAEK